MNVRLSLSQSTPALIGYTKPELIDERSYLRPTSLKGIWRWFARAFVGGVLYDDNRLCGQPGINGLVRGPRKREVHVISEIIGKELGLGYVGSEGSTASSFIIRSNVRRKPSKATAVGGRLILRGQHRELQRIRLLTLGRRRVSYFYDGLFDVFVKLRAGSRLQTDAPIRILVTALLFSGVGKGARRGLGSFDIVWVDGFSYEKNLSSFIRETYEAVKNVVLKSKDKDKLKECKDRGLPPYPVISKEAVKNLNVSKKYLVRDFNWVDMHNFFIRPERCKRIHGRPICHDLLRKTLNGWILGLPRTQRNTGYVIKDPNMTRRASPILFSYHTRRNIFGEGNFLLVTLSGDWPRRVEWRNPHTRKDINIDENRIITAESDLLNELFSLLKGSNIIELWP